MDDSTPPPAPPDLWQRATDAPPERPPLPGSLMGAAIILFILGVLAGLFGVLMVLSSAAYDQLQGSTGGLQTGQMREAAKVIAIAFGIVCLVAAAVQIGSGVGILRRAGWARIVGIVFASLSALVAALLVLLFVIAMTQPLPGGALSGSGVTEEQYRQVMQVGAGVVLGVFAAALAAYLFVLIALIRGGSAFR